MQISLSLFELRATQESTELVQRPLASVQSPARSVETPPVEKDELSALKAGLRKVKIFTEYVSTRRAKKACREEEGSEERSSARSEEGEYAYPFDSESNDEYEEGESDEAKEDPTVRKSFSYGPLAYANCAGVSFHSSTRVNGEGEDWVYFSNRRSDVGCSQMDDQVTCASDLVVLQNSKRSILPWRKRKLSFRSPKSKGEPLLKKDNGEEGGDDIDFDRRQLSSDGALSFGVRSIASLLSDVLLVILSVLAIQKPKFGLGLCFNLIVHTTWQCGLNIFALLYVEFTLANRVSISQLCLNQMRVVRI